MERRGPAAGPKDGLYLAGSDLLLAGGVLTIHDQFGYPIDPCAVVVAFNLFIQRFATMQQKPMNMPSAPVLANANTQLAAMAIAAPIPAPVTPVYTHPYT